MNTPLEYYKELYGSLAKDYKIVISWLEKEHPEVLAQFAQYLEEEE